jgi:hypothetical protein
MKITGQYLIDLGYRPAKWFSEAFQYINDKDLSEVEISEYLEQFQSPEPIPLKENSFAEKYLLISLQVT